MCPTLEFQVVEEPISGTEPALVAAMRMTMATRVRRLSMTLLTCLTLAAGCQGESSALLDDGRSSQAADTQPSSNSDTAAPRCYPADSTGNEAPECSSLQICASAMPEIHVNPTNCQPGPCAWTYEQNAGETLTYESNQGWFFLRFSYLPADYSTAALRGAFEGANFYARFPLLGKSAGQDQDAIYFESYATPDDLDVFEAGNGRLHVRVSFTVTNPYSFVLSASRICGDTNHCMCSFGGVRGHSVFDIDLPFVRP